MRARELSILLDNIMKRYDLKWDYVVSLCSTNGMVWTIAGALNKISGQFTQKSSVPSTIELVNRHWFAWKISILSIWHMTMKNLLWLVYGNTSRFVSQGSASCVVTTCHLNALDHCYPALRKRHHLEVLWSALGAYINEPQIWFSPHSLFKDKVSRAGV